jgi:prolyl-tRNA synthetase
MKDRHEREMFYGPTNEEVVTDIFRHNVKSYKQLPLNLYHIQWKFRDEIRPRFGVMRGREFLMKDAYSFDIDEKAAIQSYENMFAAYLRIFRRLGLRALPLLADTGQIGGNLSHEFHILAGTGESSLYYDEKFEQIEDAASIADFAGIYARADEKHDPKDCPPDLGEARGIEVGHVFYLGTKYSEKLGAKISTPSGDVFAHMGCYGIGVSRLVGAIIEASHDENGIIWPQSVAPFQVGIINLKVGDEKCDAMSDAAALALGDISYLQDDSDERAGSKFAAFDLIGLPWQIVIGPKGAAQNMVELKNRANGEKMELSLESAINHIIKQQK